MSCGRCLTRAGSASSSYAATKAASPLPWGSGTFTFVPRAAPVVREAERRGIEVVGELEVAWRLLPNRFVAVTGTNGKTTTVELLGAIWGAAGLPVAVAGNVGTPLSAVAGERPELLVLEVSSFQLFTCEDFRPDVAALLNFTTDHLDWHPDLEHYAAASERRLEQF